MKRKTVKGRKMGNPLSRYAGATPDVSSRLGSTANAVEPQPKPFESVNKHGIDIGMRQGNLLEQFEMCLHRLGGSWPRQSEAGVVSKADPVPDNALGSQIGINTMHEANKARLADLVNRLNDLV